MSRDRDVAHQFFEVAPLMIRTMKSEIRTVAQGRLTHPQYRILANISRGINTTGQIASDHGVSQPAMSKMVESLVQRGLIQRTSLSKDRRQIVLRLTTKGRGLYEELKEIATKNLDKKLKKISSLDKNQLQRALNDLEKILKHIRKEENL